MKVEFNTIGVIHTPYIPSLPIPHQPHQNAAGEFWITLNPDYAEGLAKLEHCRYIYVLYYLHQVDKTPQLTVHPPEVPDIQVGIFASRSPNRPNPLGLSVVEIKEINGNDIIISGIDVYNGTPLLDLKPFFRTLDNKPDANDGWYDKLDHKDHIFAHLLNLRHDHDHHDHHDHHVHHDYHDHHSEKHQNHAHNDHSSNAHSHHKHHDLND